MTASRKELERAARLEAKHQVSRMAPPSRCRWCGRLVGRQQDTVRRYDHKTGTHYRERNPLAGQYDRGGAVRMNAIDPRGYFCTMACAVRYAVRRVAALEDVAAILDGREPTNGS